MPIYSRDRSGGGTGVIANENYSEHDFGRILYESAVNDQRIFNAAIARDFHELSAMQEGTMLESELRAFQEFSVKEAWADLKKAMKKFWEKIKGLFMTVISKLTVWFVRDGKAFVKLHRKNILAKDYKNCKIPSYRKPDKSLYDRLDSVFAESYRKHDMDTIMSDVSKSNYSEDQIKNLTKTVLGEICGEKNGCEPSEFLEKLKKHVFADDIGSDKTFAERKLDFTEICARVEGSRGEIKKLKKAQAAADKVIKNAIKAIDKAAAKATDNDKNEQAYTKTQYNVASSYAAALRTQCSTVTSAQIKLIKFAVKQDRMVIGKLAAYNPKAVNDSAILEQMAWVEAADDFNTQEDIDPADVNDDDVQSDPDIVVNINIDADDCD